MITYKNLTRAVTLCLFCLVSTHAVADNVNPDHKPPLSKRVSERVTKECKKAFSAPDLYLDQPKNYYRNKLRKLLILVKNLVNKFSTKNDTWIHKSEKWIEESEEYWLPDWIHAEKEKRKNNMVVQATRAESLDQTKKEWNDFLNLHYPGTDLLSKTTRGTQKVLGHIALYVISQRVNAIIEKENQKKPDDVNKKIEVEQIKEKENQPEPNTQTNTEQEPHMNQNIETKESLKLEENSKLHALTKLQAIPQLQRYAETLIEKLKKSYTKDQQIDYLMDQTNKIQTEIDNTKRLLLGLIKEKKEAQDSHSPITNQVERDITLKNEKLMFLREKLKIVDEIFIML